MNRQEEKMKVVRKEEENRECIGMVSRKGNRIRWKR